MSESTECPNCGAHQLQNHDPDCPGPHAQAKDLVRRDHLPPLARACAGAGSCSPTMRKHDWVETTSYQLPWGCRACLRRSSTKTDDECPGVKDLKAFCNAQECSSRGEVDVGAMLYCAKHAEERKAMYWPFAGRPDIDAGEVETYEIDFGRASLPEGDFIAAAPRGRPDLVRFARSKAMARRLVLLAIAETT